MTSHRTTNTTVNPNDNNFTILNGIEKGNNLFHSFSNFSVPTGGSASFDLVNMLHIPFFRTYLLNCLVGI